MFNTGLDKEQRTDSRHEIPLNHAIGPTLFPCQQDCRGMFQAWKELIIDLLTIIVQESGSEVCPSRPTSVVTGMTNNWARIDKRPTFVVEIQILDEAFR